MAESRYLHQSHTVAVLLYHVVCAATCRRVVCSEHVDEGVREACVEIAKRYEVVFLESGTARKHGQLLLQSVAPDSPTKMVQTVQRLTARPVFAQAPAGKPPLGGGEAAIPGCAKMPEKWG